jgi:hypothetical protein
MGDGKDDNVFLVDDMVVDYVRKSPKANAAKSLPKNRPSTGLKRDSFNGRIHLVPEVETKAFPATLVPAASFPVLLRGQPMKAHLHVCTRGSLTLILEFVP